MKESDIKCKDYYIIKVNTTGYYNDKDPRAMRRFQSVIDEYRLFKEALFLKFLGKTIKDLWRQYATDIYDCAMEELCEKYKIFVHEVYGDGHLYLIPKENTEMIEWINSNLLVPHKILKKCILGHLSYRQDEKSLWPDYKRQFSYKFKESMLKKYGEEKYNDIYGA